MSFAVAFVFLEWEKEANYAWAVKKLHGLFLNNVEPSVVVIDRELALPNVMNRPSLPVNIFYIDGT